MIIDSFAIACHPCVELVGVFLSFSSLAVIAPLLSSILLAANASALVIPLILRLAAFSHKPTISLSFRISISYIDRFFRALSFIFEEFMPFWN